MDESSQLMSGQSATPADVGRTATKWVLWFLLGAMTLSVLVFFDLPLLTSVTDKPALKIYLTQRLPFVIPHVIGSFIALCIRPLQFSSRLRQRNIKRHRLLGQIYVAAIVVAAITAYLIVWGDYSPFGAEVVVLASLWLITTAIAFIAARKRQIVQHRQWMIRSYAVTFLIFAVNRFPSLFNYHPSRAGSICQGLSLAILALLIPDIAFTWLNLRGPRK
jgi:uncharacterized membrane protein